MEPIYQSSQPPRNTMPPMPPVSAPESGSSMKYVWVVIAVIVLLAAAYFWYSGTSSLYKSNDTVTEEAVPAADDVTSIETDLGTTNLDDLGVDLDSLEMEINQ